MFVYDVHENLRRFKKVTKKVFLNYDVVVIKNETKSMRIKKRKEEKKSVKYKHWQTFKTGFLNIQNVQNTS